MFQGEAEESNLDGRTAQLAVKAELLLSPVVLSQGRVAYAAYMA